MKYDVEILGNSTYKVLIKNSEHILFQGTIVECQAFIWLKVNGYYK